MLDQIRNNPLTVVLVVGYVSSAAVNALPLPGTVADLTFRQVAYQWLFTFAHTLMNNVEQAAKAKYPQVNFGQKKIQE